MKTLFTATVTLAIFFVSGAKGQTVDTLINVGTHSLHFTITPGDGTPIIFESGAGNDGSVWSELCELLQQRLLPIRWTGITR